MCLVLQHTNDLVPLIETFATGLAIGEEASVASCASITLITANTRMTFTLTSLDITILILGSIPVTVTHLASHFWVAELAQRTFRTLEAAIARVAFALPVELVARTGGRSHRVTLAWLTAMARGEIEVARLAFATVHTLHVRETGTLAGERVTGATIWVSAELVADALVTLLLGGVTGVVGLAPFAVIALRVV